MRNVMIAVMTVLALSFAVLSSAAEPVAGGSEKDECLLASRGCQDQVDSIQQKIKKLHNEIEKGTRVYTPAELKKLEQSLKDANAILDNLNKPGNR